MSRAVQTWKTNRTRNCDCGHTHTSLNRKRSMRGMSREGGGRRGARKRKCACERVCVKDALLQSIKVMESALLQMTCGPKANKMANVLSCRNLFLLCHRSLKKDSALEAMKNMLRTSYGDSAHTLTRAPLCLERRKSVGKRKSILSRSSLSIQGKRR